MCTWKREGRGTVYKIRFKICSAIWPTNCNFGWTIFSFARTNILGLGRILVTVHAITSHKSANILFLELAMDFDTTIVENFEPIACIIADI